MSKPRIFVAKVAPSKLPKNADVVAVASDEGPEFEETKFVARLLHGARTEVHFVEDLAELVKFLCKFESIRRLVFMFHGSPGEIRVGPNEVELSKIGNELLRAKASLRCTELVFEGCNIASGGTEIAALMDALRTKVASGYACFHGWKMRGFEVHPDTTAAAIEGERTYKRIRRFVIPRQPGPTEMARKPGTHFVAIEYFTLSPPSENVFDTGLEGEVGKLCDRSQLDRKVFPLRNAKDAEQYDNPVGSTTLVRIVR